MVPYCPGNKQADWRCRLLAVLFVVVELAALSETESIMWTGTKTSVQNLLLVGSSTSHCRTCAGGASFGLELFTNFVSGTLRKRWR